MNIQKKDCIQDSQTCKQTSAVFAKPKKKKNKHKHLSFALLNIRSIRNKLHELDIFLDSLDFKPHILIITESWLTDIKQFPTVEIIKGEEAFLFSLNLM